MNTFRRHWPLIRNGMALMAIPCCLLAAGTSDYHTMELGVTEPASVRWLLIVAVVLLIPKIAQIIIEHFQD